MIELIEGATERDLISLYDDPYIQRVGWDDVPASPVDHPCASYLSAMVGHKFAGAFLAIRFSDIEIELHSLLKKEYVSYSRELGKLAINWAFSNPEVNRVTAYIISDLSTAINFCIKMGFKFEGIRKEACRKDGKFLDVHIFGILRSEWSKS